MTIAITAELNGLMAGEALRRFAAGEISPELAVSELLSRPEQSPQIEAALGAAIWEALERRESGLADRLAEVQKLWNRRRHTLHEPVQSL